MSRVRIPVEIGLAALALLFGACGDDGTSAVADTVVDTAGVDTASPADAGDTAATNTEVLPDTVADDTVAPDVLDTMSTTEDDTSTVDTTPVDTTPADTSPPDTIPVDTTPADTTPAGCPVAVIGIQEGDAVAPPTTLHLDATDSYGGTGGIMAYSWTVTQPDGSFSVLTPSAAHATPTFEAAMAGAYTFGLTVTDRSGVDSCEPASITVVATPTAAIHLELWWDDNLADGIVDVGADLDLHVRDPDAVGVDIGGTSAPDGWFDSTFDCFWANPAPTWPDENGTNRAPRLLRRDDAGYGPEVIAIEAPAHEREYLVGFHVWSTTGTQYLAPTEIKIWIDGVLKNKPGFLPPRTEGQFYHVMTVKYPSGGIGFPYVEVADEYTSPLQK